MRTIRFGIENHKKLTLTVCEFDDIQPIYTVEDKKGISGNSRISWKRALYNYNRNKKKMEEKKKNGRRKNV